MKEQIQVSFTSDEIFNLLNDEAIRRVGPQGKIKSTEILISDNKVHSGLVTIQIFEMKS